MFGPEAFEPSLHMMLAHPLLSAKILHGAGACPQLTRTAQRAAHRAVNRWLFLAGGGRLCRDIHDGAKVFFSANEFHAKLGTLTPEATLLTMRVRLSYAQSSLLPIACSRPWSPLVFTGYLGARLPAATFTSSLPTQRLPRVLLATLSLSSLLQPPPSRKHGAKH